MKNYIKRIRKVCPKGHITLRYIKKQRYRGRKPKHPNSYFCESCNKYYKPLEIKEKIVISDQTIQFPKYLKINRR